MLGFGTSDQLLSSPPARPPPHTTMPTRAVQQGRCNRATINKNKGSPVWSSSISCCNSTPNLQQGATRSAPQDGFCAGTMAKVGYVLDCMLTLSYLLLQQWHAVLLRYAVCYITDFNSTFLLTDPLRPAKSVVLYYCVYYMQSPCHTKSTHFSMLSSTVVTCVIRLSSLAPLMAWPLAAPMTLGHKIPSVCIL